MFNSFRLAMIYLYFDCYQPGLDSTQTLLLPFDLQTQISCSTTADATSSLLEGQHDQVFLPQQLTEGPSKLLLDAVEGLIASAALSWPQLPSMVSAWKETLQPGHTPSCLPVGAVLHKGMLLFYTPVAALMWVCSNHPLCFSSVCHQLAVVDDL